MNNVKYISELVEGLKMNYLSFERIYVRFVLCIEFDKELLL